MIIFKISIIFALIVLVIISFFPSDNIGKKSREIRVRITKILLYNIVFGFIPFIVSGVNKMTKKKENAVVEEVVFGDTEESWPIVYYNTNGYRLGDTYDGKFISFKITPGYDEKNRLVFFVYDPFLE